MHVVATAGHVDHGKSTLVRALTGMEPDRWSEERRRGMTIDLGFAWTHLPSGRTVAFVDVPGHQRFIGNMLAGLGPAPAVMMVVAADEGWREQSTEHLAAVDALGIRHGLLVVTRSDLADPGPALERSRQCLAGTSLAGVEAVTVSGHTGANLPELRVALDRLVAGLPPPVVDARVRLWVDRSFTIRGSGTVVTGTLPAGTIRVGDRLQLRNRLVQVRGLQSLGAEESSVAAVSRVAVNLRAVGHDDVGRGDALLTPDAWWCTSSVDVRAVTGTVEVGNLPTGMTLSVGTAALPAHVRPLGHDTARITFSPDMPLQIGDRAILSDRSGHRHATGVLVLDVDPVPLRRRGAAAARARELATLTGLPGVGELVSWRECLARHDLRAWGVDPEPSGPADGVRRVGDWIVADARWERWRESLSGVVDAHRNEHPDHPALPETAARMAIGLPDPGLLPALAADAGLRFDAGMVSRPGESASLGQAEAAVAEIEEALRARPFAAPERGELDRLSLGRGELSLAVKLGRVLVLRPDIVLLPNAPQRAVQILSALEQPFTVSQARQALGTTRRVAVPLLEYLDRQGFTRRVDSDRRIVR